MDTEAELARERAVLTTADRDLKEGEMRIATQERLIAGLGSRGRDTAEAERLLQLLRDTLAQWQAHRVLIAGRISYLETRLSGAEAPDNGF